MMSLNEVKEFPWQEQLFKGLLADKTLLLLIAALLSLGAIMVASSSISVAALPGDGYSDPWYFARRHFIFLLLSLAACSAVACIPLVVWRNYGWLLLIAAIFILVLVLIPGIGTEVKNSRRWLRIGSINLQASELAKFCSVLFFSSYLAKWHLTIKQSNTAIFKPLAVLTLICLLILMEPDLGSTVVLAITVGAMLFIAGIKLWQCGTLLGAAGLSLYLLIRFEPYRLTRFEAFLDPWQHQFGSAYQLVQSLIGFGRGEWLGLGLGNSIQKLFFLPEAHTDFVFAIIAEEFGFIGALVVIGLFVALIVKALYLAKKAIYQDNDFACFAAYGVGVMLAAQVFINVGVASGLLPTKGLTLPFISYGGSSLLVTMMMMGLLIRIQKELQVTLKPMAEVTQ